jgi:1,4-alpha-glucan branching enzyme
MTPADLQALVGGYHGDPFRLLGPHESEDAQCVIRSFLPQASSAEVVVGEDAIPMTKVHPEGLYEAALPVRPKSYRLRVTRYDKSVQEIEDPYRFWDQLSDTDIYLHAQGTLYEAWKTLGAHPSIVSGVEGVRFAVWAPSAEMVSVVGDFNAWDVRRHPMRRREGGIWEIFLPEVRAGQIYKYFVRSKVFGVHALKCDPYGFASEVPPKQGSVVWDITKYEWQDAAWLKHRAETQWLDQPMSVYEVHLESWMRDPEGNPLTYREMASRLVSYAKNLGFTHLELMPPMEHPFSGSWGYQVVGYFAPTVRFGTPDDFKFFIDQCHQAGLGVIVDWVPAHFPKDAHGLARFDGTACYEHEDPRQGEHKDWGTLIFNFGRNEVRNFLVSNALFWLSEYHIDALRVDAVASMIYLDYSRQSENWVPNKYGGRENLEAIDFLRIFNTETHKIEGTLTIAEESTSYAGVSRPVYTGGLGFTLKWNMGWMHDMFAYFKSDPIHRKFNHHHITFSLLYAFNENFLLPISHDEVVHGKSSLLGKMPGDEWQKFANVRAFFGYMFAHPGKKLLFMGCELGMYEEWNYLSSLRWDLLQYPHHRSLQEFVRQLNKFYASERALYEVDFHWSGFEWIDINDLDKSVISFVRRAKNPNDYLVVVCNFTPIPRHNYDVGVPDPGAFQEVMNSDWSEFGGSGVSNPTLLWSKEGSCQGRYHSIAMTLPPLGVVYLRRVLGKHGESLHG